MDLIRATVAAGFAIAMVMIAGPAGAQTLRGPDSLIGNTLRTELFTAYFDPSGRYVDRDSHLPGTWEIDGSKMCVDPDGAAKRHCVFVEVRAARVKLITFEASGEMKAPVTGDVLPGNPWALK